MTLVERLRPAHCYAIIAVSILLVFGQIVWHGFVEIDDMLLITGNSAIQRISGANLVQIFSMYDPELYIPLTFLTYQIEYAFVGATPWLYHLTSLLLHLGSALLIFQIATRLSRNQTVGLLCALLWALHPLQTEAVAWAAARKDTLSAFLFFAALLQYLRYIEKRTMTTFWLTVGLFTLALLSKVTVIMLPFALLLLDFHEERRDFKRMVIEKIPFFILSGVFGLVALAGKDQNIAGLTLFEQILLWCKSAVHVLRQIFLPFDLRLFYQQWTPISLNSLEFIVPLIIILALALTLALFRRNKTYIFGALFALAMYAPVFATFTKIHRHFFASDRYSYIVLFGVMYALAVATVALSRRFRPVESAAALIVLLLAGMSVLQAGTWHTSEALFTQTLRFEKSALAEQNLGVYYIKEERREDGIAAFTRSLEAEPDNDGAHVNLGRLAAEDGRSEDALAHFQAAADAVEKRPVLYPTDLLPYYELSEWYDARGRTEEMFTQLRRAVERGPIQPDAHFNLGLKLQKYGRLDESYASYKEAIKLQPTYLSALYSLAAVSAELGKIDEAIELLQRVQRLQPGYEKTEYHLQNLRRLQS